MSESALLGEGDEESLTENTVFEQGFEAEIYKFVFLDYTEKTKHWYTILRIFHITVNNLISLTKERFDNSKPAYLGSNSLAQRVFFPPESISIVP